MKKFTNETVSTAEKAIKIGRNVPLGAVGLTWFESNEVTPSNTVGIVDYSDLIIENRISEKLYGSSQVAYADELGILRKVDGSYNFQSSDLSISDLPLSSRIQKSKVNIQTLDSSDYVHYKYVSRHFISAPNAFSISSENSFVEANALSGLSIKVVDKNGFEYIDEKLNRKKYRILLEPYRTEENYQRAEVPHRVIVFLDSSVPDTLSLVYDKVESDDFGSVFNMELGYSESINPVPLYSEIPEESFVLDRTTTGEKVFSIKKLDNKYSEIVNNSPSENGYQVLAPLKAFSDYRTYETFNWRLIARSKISVNTSNVDSSLAIDNESIKRRTINVGVLYDPETQKSNDKINPYIFRRLEQSPFNSFNYIFDNPYGSVESLNAGIVEKDHAEYWKVDITDLSIDLRKYDVLAWSPSAKIEPNHEMRIRSFLEKSKTLILDLGSNNTPYDVAANIGCANLLKERDETTVSELRIEDSPITNDQRCGGWNLVNGTDYVQDYYGVWGSINIGTGPNVEYKKYKHFVDGSGSFLNIVEDPNDPNPSIARFIPYLNNSDSLSRGNVLATTFNLMNYCNAVYGLATNQVAISQNTGTTAYPDSAVRYSGLVEGPLKLLFNTCSYALYSLAKSSRVSDERSAIYNYVSTWYPSWTMNQSALLDEEKDSLFVNVSKNTTDKQYARDLMSGFDSVKEFIKREFDSLSDFISSRLNTDIDDIEVFIEVTNPSVDIVNSINISEEEKVNIDIPSSYKLFKIIDNEAKAYAETTAYSMQLRVPSTYGNYIIIEKPANYSKDVELKDSLNVMDNITSYPFDLECSYSYFVPGAEKYVSYKPSLDINYSLNMKAKFYEPTTRTETSERVQGPDSEPYASPANDIRSSIDDESGVKASVSDVTNIFPYTGDIDQGNKTEGWRNGQYGPYATYVQWVLKQANPSYYPYNLDNYYGPGTANGVRSFQRDQKERYVDGVVDSETKWYLAKFLQNNNIDISPLRSISEEAYRFADAAKKTVRAYEIESKKDYKKITFTGTSGPGHGEDILFFKFNPTFSRSIQSMIITAVDGWDNFEIVEIGVASSFSTNVNNYSREFTADRQGLKFEVNLSGISNSSVRAGYIKVRGNKLGGSYGSKAEGFGIREIKLKGTDEGSFTGGDTTTVFDRYIPEDVDVIVDIDIDDYLLQEEVSAAQDLRFDITNNNNYVGILSAVESKANITQFKYGENSYSVNKTLQYVRENKIRVDFGDPQKNGYLEIIVPVGSLTSLIDSSTISYELRKVFAATDNSLVWDSNEVSTSNPLTAVKSGNEFVISTSSVYFSDGVTIVETKSLSSGYTLRSADVNGIIYDDQRKTVNINDGVLLLCNSAGDPYGVPTVNEISAQISSEDLDSTDIRLGTLIVKNSEAIPGMVYGFFDLNQNEFLGTRIDYIDYVDPEKSVYIAVAALDADGDIFSDNEFIGSSGKILFRPVRVPMKYVAPVYSVVMNKPSAIKVEPMDGLMSRFDTWSLPITNGYFEKKIRIEGSFDNSDWRNNYSGQYLVGIYSTSNLSLNNSSKIYGKDSIDIYDENPILLDDKKIKLRRVPILSWNHPTTYESSIFGIVKPVVEVYTKNSVDDDWAKVSYSDIRDIDCQTGVIEFIGRIVPSDNSLIKVNYTIKSKNSMVKRVGANPIPLNPVLDQDSISFNKPLFIYILPRELYSLSTSAPTTSSRQRVSEYSTDSVIQYTYDSDIFNKNSSKYDPLALLLAAMYVSDKPENIPPNTMDIRVRGGGVIQDIDVNKLINEIPEVLYNWDVYSADTEAYTKGGYIIIKIPQSVKDNFVDQDEVYSIIKSNLTAGVVFELQDMNGNTWS